jgi:hypothetical protein
MKRNHKDDNEIDLGGVEDLTEALDGVNAKTYRKPGDVDVPEPEVKDPTDDLDSHRTASEMDHPRGSVRMKHFDKQTRDAIQRILESSAQGNAEDMSLEDTAGLYTAEDVEAALAEIAGAGRTAETVKGNADDIATNTVDIASYRDVHTVTNADYTILDDDDYAVILVTTGAVNRTITLPTAIDNPERQIKIVNVDSGAGKVIVDGEGAETINGTPTWEVTEQYGYVELVSNASTWFVIGQGGCIYEQWQTSDVVLADNTNWQECFNLAGVPPGRYEVEFWGILEIGSSLGKYKYMTLSNATATEEDNKYTCYVRLGGENLAEGHSLFTKRFLRNLASATTLYLNARKTMADAVFALAATSAEAYIRATRIG